MRTKKKKQSVLGKALKSLEAEARRNEKSFIAFYPDSAILDKKFPMLPVSKATRAIGQEVADEFMREVSKDTNPKDAVGTAKVPLFSVLPMRVLSGLALAMLEGARKYGRHNYRAAGVRASVYVDALGRHIAAWYEGEDLDPNTGTSHLDHALACLVVLRDSMYQGNWTDDRPPKADASWVEASNARAKEIIAKYPNALPAVVAKESP